MTYNIDSDKFDKGGLGFGIQALVRSFRYVFVLLSIFITGTVIWYFTFLGYFTVNPQEAVVVLRFGKVANVYTEDWHWAFPYPVSRIVRIPTSRQALVIKNFWPNPDASVTSEQDEISMMSRPLSPGRDGALLTGDANIIHTEWEVVYEISNPLEYYENLLCPANLKGDDEIFRDAKGRPVGSRGPRTTIASIIEGEIIKVTAVQKVEDALYKDVTGYQEAVELAARKALDAARIGVSLNSVLIKMKTPPFSTVSAFHDVINAEQESSSAKLKAMNYANKSAQEADTESRNIIVDAEVYRSRTVSEIQAESEYFRRILAEYRKSPESVTIPLYSETVVSMLAGLKDKYIIPEISPGGAQELRIMLTPEPSYKKEMKESEME